LTFSSTLIVRKIHSSMSCQTRMDLKPGIVVGTVNRLQLNEWNANRWYRRRVWQLIAIFGKVNMFPVCDHCLFNPPYQPAS
jgi:hypothetical protein